MAMRVRDNKLQVNVGDALGLLRRCLTKGLCKRVFREHRTDERERVWALYPLMWFWVMVSAQGVSAMQEAVKLARKGWQGLVRRIQSSRQGLSKRAQEFSWTFFMEVFHEVVKEVAKEAKPRYCQDLHEQTRKKWPRVLVVDASKLDPISKQLKILRKLKDQVLPGVVLAVYDLYGGILRRLKFDPDAARSEYKMAVEWLQEEEPEALKETLLIADRLYGTPGFLAELGQKGAWGLVRRNRSVKIRKRKLLSRCRLQGHGLTLQDWQVQVGQGASAQTLRCIRLTGPRGRLEWFTHECAAGQEADGMGGGGFLSSALAGGAHVRHAQVRLGSEELSLRASERGGASGIWGGAGVRGDAGDAGRDRSGTGDRSRLVVDGEVVPEIPAGISR